LLKHKTADSHLGELSIDIDTDEFSFKPNPEYQRPLPAFLFYKSDKISENEQIKMWVMGRAPDPNNELIDALIDKIGETKYDAYSFFKHNKGVFITDKFYVESL
jgi:hypothetical protein